MAEGQELKEFRCRYATVAKHSGNTYVIHFLYPNIGDEQYISQMGDMFQRLSLNWDESSKPHVILDFSKVERLSGAGLNKIIRLHKYVKLTEGQLSIAAIDADLYEVFEITNLAGLFSFEKDLKTALEKKKTFSEKFAHLLPGYLEKLNIAIEVDDENRRQEFWPERLRVDYKAVGKTLEKEATIKPGEEDDFDRFSNRMYARFDVLKEEALKAMGRWDQTLNRPRRMTEAERKETIREKQENRGEEAGAISHVGKDGSDSLISKWDDEKLADALYKAAEQKNRLIGISFNKEGKAIADRKMDETVRWLKTLREERQRREEQSRKTTR